MEQEDCVCVCCEDETSQDDRKRGIGVPQHEWERVRISMEQAGMTGAEQHALVKELTGVDCPCHMNTDQLDAIHKAIEAHQ